MVNDTFFEKIISNLDTADKNNVQAVIQRIAKERAFFQMVFNAINEGIVVIGSDLKIKYVNRAADTILGIPDNYEEQSITTFFREINWKEMLTSDGKWHKGTRCEVQIMYPTTRLLLFYLVPLAVDSDSATIILHDITESRKKTQETIESEKMHMISLLAAGVAHEIGNPLNSLNIHLQLLKRILDNENPDRKEAAEILDIASDEVSRLDKIITQFLQSVRSAKPNMTEQKIKPLIIETLKSLKLEIEGKKINVNCSWPDDMPAVHGDENQLKQAFYNLIKNSIQAMTDSGQLDIECRYTDDFVELNITDTGKGISPEELSKIFEPYYTTKKEGSGLGLMIVERIFREHGAELSINSEPGKTVFSIRFPRTSQKIRLLPPAEPVSASFPISRH